MAAYHIHPLNERAVTISFGGDISLDTHHRIMLVDNKIKLKNFGGFVETVPAYNTLTIYYDPCPVIRDPSLAGENAFERIRSLLIEILSEPIEQAAVHEQPVITIPVCYDYSFGPDLEHVSSVTGKSLEEIIAIHTREIYTVFMMGFSPGFPYLGILAPELEVMRKEVPRLLVPAGSVAIAGRQTGIYPFDTPGGWQIIGKTPLRLFNTEMEGLTLFRPGFRVKFESININDFETMKAHEYSSP